MGGDQCSRCVGGKRQWNGWRRLHGCQAWQKPLNRNARPRFELSSVSPSWHASASLAGRPRPSGDCQVVVRRATGAGANQQTVRDELGKVARCRHGRRAGRRDVRARRHTSAYRPPRSRRGAGASRLSLLSGPEPLDFTRMQRRELLHQYWNKRAQVGQPIGPCLKHKDAKRQRVDALLKCRIAVNRYECIEPTGAALKQRAISTPVQPSPTTVETSWPVMSRARRRSTRSSSSNLTRRIRSIDPSPAREKKRSAPA
jgi:hypothetical protein